jgi:hypothetical protein
LGLYIEEEDLLVRVKIPKSLTETVSILGDNVTFPDGWSFGDEVYYKIANASIHSGVSCVDVEVPDDWGRKFIMANINKDLKLPDAITVVKQKKVKKVKEENNETV